MCAVSIGIISSAVMALNAIVAAVVDYFASILIHAKLSAGFY